MPKEYIYEPWTAPLSVQEKARCIVGRDYPKPGEKNISFQAQELSTMHEPSVSIFLFPLPVVDHEAASKECRKRMGEAYASNRLGGNTVNGKTSESSRRKSSDGGQDASDLSKSKQPKRRS